MARRLTERDDPTHRRSAALFRAFGWYLHWYFSLNFRAVRLARPGLPALPPDRPVIVYTNHPSWWDPALCMLLASGLFRGRPGYGPMDASSIARYRLFERFGVFGIDLDSPRGAARFLDVSLRVLAHPRNMLWITAEGHFTDPRPRPVRLRPGIAHLARRLPHAIMLPMAIEYGFWNERKPEVLVRFGDPVVADNRLDVLGWTSLLQGALEGAMDALADDAQSRNPARFRTLVRGGVGVGGIYDLWRRSRAWSAGRRFDPSHQGES